jgi:hypothetical protein
MKNLKFDPKNWEWYAFLNASEEVKEEFTADASALANAWITCACGQICNVLPKTFFGSPRDREARYLGLDFNAQIQDENWDEAKITLDEIEARTIFLLKQPNYIDPKTL